MKTSFKNEGIQRTFVDKQKQREFTTRRPIVNEIRKIILLAEGKMVPDGSMEIQEEMKSNENNKYVGNYP